MERFVQNFTVSPIIINKIIKVDVKSKEIKALKFWENIPILLVTAFNPDFLRIHQS